VPRRVEHGHLLSSFNGYFTASKHWRFSFAVFFGIPVNSKGAFHWSRQNAVNTPDGGTLAKTSKVTIDGKFISRQEATGTYKLHKAPCKRVSFDVKLQK
jgi:hypothetical protein